MKLSIRFGKINFDEYYLSYSGGKDSHLLYWFIKDYLKDDKIKIVGVNTYREHSEIRERIYKNCDVVLKPEMSMKDINEKYGMPCFTKVQDGHIHNYQKGSRAKSTMERVARLPRDNGYISGFALNKKASNLTLSGELHKVSNECCTYTKKSPLEKYEQEQNKKTIIGVRGGESLQRKAKYTQCLDKKGKFSPLFDFDNRTCELIYKLYDIEIPSVYNYVNRTGCFTPEVEVCTDKGFIRLDSLDGTEKVLTIQDNLPIYEDYKKVEIPYDGDLVKVKLQQKYVLTTPNHKFIGYNRDKKIIENKQSKDMSRLSIFANMRYSNDNSSLSDMERIYIAIQADGHLCEKYNDFTFRFHLHK